MVLVSANGLQHWFAASNTLAVDHRSLQESAAADLRVKMIYEMPIPLCESKFRRSDHVPRPNRVWESR